jgi:hypothetical protein
VKESQDQAQENKAGGRKAKEKAEGKQRPEGRKAKPLFHKINSFYQHVSPFKSSVPRCRSRTDYARAHRLRRLLVDGRPHSNDSDNPQQQFSLSRGRLKHGANVPRRSQLPMNRAPAILKRRLGSDHPNTATVRDHPAALEAALGKAAHSSLCAAFPLCEKGVRLDLRKCWRMLRNAMGCANAGR